MARNPSNRTSAAAKGARSDATPSRASAPSGRRTRRPNSVPRPPSSQSSSDRSRTPVERGSKRSLYPGDTVSRAMTKLYKEKLCPEGYTWTAVSKEIREWYWTRFQEAFTYPENEEDKIYRVWYRHAGRRYADFFSKLRRQPGKKPNFVSQSIWDAYWMKWNKPEFQVKCRKMSANRRSEVNGEGTGMSIHTGGSRPADRYARELAQQVERDVNSFEVYTAYHWSKKKGKWADPRADKVALELESLIVNDESLADDSNLDEAERNKRINEHYMTAAGGINEKQRLYGLGLYGASQICSDGEGQGSSGQGLPQASQDASIERVRAECRAEMQQTLNEYMARTHALEAQIEQLMACMSSFQTSPPKALPPRSL